MGNELTYFKFVCELIDAGIWAKMSPAARTLYPVLLRFSDRNFSPVYPGSKKLMELTGFKQKSSLRKARNELVELGLISITLGNGRKNTIYHFRFDWITPRGTQKYPSESRNPTTTEGSNSTPVGDTEVDAPGYSPIPPYNQIQISINNHPVPSTNSNHQEMQKDPFEELKKQFGEKSVQLAISEAQLADLPITPDTIYKILTGSIKQPQPSVEGIFRELENKVSENSLKLIKSSYIRQENDFFIFSNDLPLYLKNILIKISDKILFENINHSANLAIREGWR